MSVGPIIVGFILTEASREEYFNYKMMTVFFICLAFVGLIVAILIKLEDSVEGRLLGIIFSEKT